MMLSETEEAVERRIGPLERAARRPAEAKDGTSEVESELAGLQEAVGDGRAEVEEVAGLKPQLSDCCTKVDRALPNLERERAKLNKEVRATRPKVDALGPARHDS